MNIIIENLGYVKKINVDLNKNLTIFCGPNNTGKTYIAYALYGFMNIGSDFSKFNILNEKSKELKNIGKVSINIVEDIFKNKKFNENLSALFLSNLKHIFASDKNLFAKTRIQIDNLDSDYNKNQVKIKDLKYNIIIKNEFLISFYKEKNSDIIDCFLVQKNTDSNKQNEKIPLPILNTIFANEVISKVLDILLPNTYITPVERIAVNIFSKELSIKRNTLVDKLLELNTDSKNANDIVNKRATRYPMPIRDSLEISEDLNIIKKNKSKFEYLANELENDILKGEVLISKEGEVQFKPDKAKSVKLPINLSASVVKSLANLVIYFRYLAKENDFIIIDEPELNLHPDNQIIIARTLVKIMNNNFKVLISTHSDYIIRELNNLIMLYSQQDLIKKYDINEKSILNPIDVDVFLFHYKTKKVEKIKVTKSGFEIETIDEVINDLNNRSQELFFNLEENNG